MCRYEFSIIDLDKNERTVIVSGDEFPEFLESMYEAFDEGEILGWTYDVLI